MSEKNTKKPNPIFLSTKEFINSGLSREQFIAVKLGEAVTKMIIPNTYKGKKFKYVIFWQ